MLLKVRRARSKRLVVSAKFSIDPYSRSHVDGQIGPLRRSVIPITGVDTRQRPYLVGSGIAVQYKGRPVLVTAAHVLGDEPAPPRWVFGSDGWNRPLCGDLAVSPEDDLAAFLIDEGLAASMDHVPLIPEELLARVGAPEEPFYACVVGYPATASKLREGNALDTPMEVFSHFGVERADGVVSVAFDRQEGGQTATGHETPRKPIGKSGGAIFGFKVQGQRVVTSEPPRLVGVSTLWKRGAKRIEAASVAKLLPLLDHLIAEAGP